MAYVLSSVSGNLISAASAGFAPTNSADVSAIASAYQVVSATATQLYAGTAYVTSVNDNPLSASRAGNAANASLANSAWYDGTGRLISALPDSAAVSSIASSYAESAASSKLDESATADFYSTSNPSGFITGVDLSDYAFNSSLSSKLDTSASSSFYPSDNPSGFITSVDLTNYATTSYVDSSVSSKLDATASSQFLTSVPSEYATTAYVDSSVSSKLDSTASSQFLTSTAGLVGTGDLTAYAYESSNSAKLDTTAFSTVSSQFLTGLPADLVYTADISGFAYESAVSAWTAKQDALTFGYDSSNNISSIDGSAIGGQGGGASIPIGTSGDYVTSVSSQMLMGTNSAIKPGESSTSIYTELAFGTADSVEDYFVFTDAGVNQMTFEKNPDAWSQVFYRAADTADNTISEGELSDGTLNLPGLDYFYYTSYGQEMEEGETYFSATAYNSVMTPPSVFEIGAASAISGKQDSLAFSYNPNSAITAINGSGIGADVLLPISGSSNNGTFYSANLTVNNGLDVYQSSTNWQGQNHFDASTIWMLETANGSGTSVTISIPTVDLWNSAASSVSSKQDTLTFGYDGANISSIDGSALAGGGGGLEYGATAANSNNKIGLGASGTGTKTDAGLYLSSTHGTGFYKVNEMTLNRSGYAETVKFNLDSAGSQVLLSASGTTRGAFHSAWNASASASFGVSGKSAYLKLGSHTAYDTSIEAWNDTYGTVANNSATWGGSSLQISAGNGISLSVIDNVLVISTAV